MTDTTIAEALSLTLEAVDKLTDMVGKQQLQINKLAKCVNILLGEKQ